MCVERQDQPLSYSQLLQPQHMIGKPVSVLPATHSGPGAASPALTLTFEVHWDRASKVQQLSLDAIIKNYK